MTEYLVVIQLNHTRMIYKKTNNVRLMKEFIRRLSKTYDVTSVRWIKLNSNRVEKKNRE